MRGAFFFEKEERSKFFDGEGRKITVNEVGRFEDKKDRFQGIGEGQYLILRETAGTVDLLK